MAVDSVETADYYKDKNPKLFGGLGRMYGDDYSIQLREDAVPFVLSTLRRVSIPLTDIGMVVVAKPRVVASSDESEEKETHQVRTCVGFKETQ